MAETMMETAMDNTTEVANGLLESLRRFIRESSKTKLLLVVAGTVVVGAIAYRATKMAAERREMQQRFEELEKIFNNLISDLSATDPEIAVTGMSIRMNGLNNGYEAYIRDVVAFINQVIKMNNVNINAVNENEFMFTESSNKKKVTPTNIDVARQQVQQAQQKAAEAVNDLDQGKQQTAKAAAKAVKAEKDLEQAKHNLEEEIKNQAISQTVEKEVAQGTSEVVNEAVEHASEVNDELGALIEKAIPVIKVKEYNVNHINKPKLIGYHTTLINLLDFLNVPYPDLYPIDPDTEKSKLAENLDKLRGVILDTGIISE